MTTTAKPDIAPSEQKLTDQDPSSQQLDTVLEVNENVPSEIFEKPFEDVDFVEISPRIFGLTTVCEPLTIPSLNNAIYELGVVNMCWPDINDPVFETRTCFPPSYYTNSPKERLLLAYAENFRRQYNFHFKMRRPILLQVPNECGLQVVLKKYTRCRAIFFLNTQLRMYLKRKWHVGIIIFRKWCVLQ